MYFVLAALQGFEKNSQHLIDAFGPDKIIEWRRSYDTAPPSFDDLDFISKISKKIFDKNLAEVNSAYYDEAMKCIMKYNLKSSNLPYQSSSMSIFSSLHPEFPLTESLKQCEMRAYGYWKHIIAPQVHEGKRVLIVAHANTIRALVKAMDNIDDDMIVHLKIPNGIPLVYTLDDSLQPVLDLTDDLGFQANYLVSARNHAKVGN